MADVFPTVLRDPAEDTNTLLIATDAPRRVGRRSSSTRSPSLPAELRPRARAGGRADRARGSRAAASTPTTARRSSGSSTPRSSRSPRGASDDSQASSGGCRLQPTTRRLSRSRRARHLARGERAAEQEALGERRAVGDEELALRLGLDALGHRGHLERAGEGEDGGEDRAGAAVARDARAAAPMSSFSALTSSSWRRDSEASAPPTSSIATAKPGRAQVARRRRRPAPGGRATAPRAARRTSPAGRRPWEATRSMISVGQLGARDLARRRR